MSRTVSRRSLLSSAAAAAAAAQLSGPARGASAKPPVAVSSSNGLRAVARAVQRMGEGAYGGASMWNRSTSGKPATFAVADAAGARLEECASLCQRQ